MRQYTRPAPPVKANRKSSKPAAPFGAGILERTSQDESWYFARLREMERDDPTDREFDEMARTAEWQYKYEQGLTAPERCYLCKTPSASLVAGLCPTCIEALDRDGDLGGEGGQCAACSRIVDFLEDSGMCLPCEMSATDASTKCQTGQRRVY